MIKTRMLILGVVLGLCTGSDQAWASYAIFVGKHLTADGGTCSAEPATNPRVTGSRSSRERPIPPVQRFEWESTPGRTPG